MKYLKKLEMYKSDYHRDYDNHKKAEQRIKYISEIREFVKNGLVYILDDYNFNLNFVSPDDTVIFSLTYSNKANYSLYNFDINNHLFNYDDIKDEFIPFMESLNSKYNIKTNDDGTSVLLSKYKGDSRYIYYKYSMEDVLEDKIDNLLITDIKVTIDL